MHRGCWDVPGTSVRPGVGIGSFGLKYLTLTLKARSLFNAKQGLLQHRLGWVLLEIGLGCMYPGPNSRPPNLHRPTRKMTNRLNSNVS